MSGEQVKKGLDGACMGSPERRYKLRKNALGSSVLCLLVVIAISTHGWQKEILYL
jgi:hypothetical protein